MPSRCTTRRAQKPAARSTQGTWHGQQRQSDIDAKQARHASRQHQLSALQTMKFITACRIICKPASSRTLPGTTKSTAAVESNAPSSPTSTAVCSSGFAALRVRFAGDSAEVPCQPTTASRHSNACRSTMAENKQINRTRSK